MSHRAWSDAQPTVPTARIVIEDWLSALARRVIWKSKARFFDLVVESPAGLSPQGYSPWTSLNNRLVALDPVRSFSCDEAPPGGNACAQRKRVRCPEHSIG